MDATIVKLKEEIKRNSKVKSPKEPIKDKFIKVNGKQCF